MGLTEIPGVANMPDTHAVVSCPCGFYCLGDATYARVLHAEHMAHCEKAYHAPPEPPRSAKEVITLKMVSTFQIIAIIVIISWVWLKAGGII
jgi:hypothetical protein